MITGTSCSRHPSVVPPAYATAAVPATGSVSGSVSGSISGTAA